MDKTSFYKDNFWRELRSYYRKMTMISSMRDYYEGVCWGLTAASYDMDVISTNTFRLITKLLLETHKIYNDKEREENIC